jgi:phage terminase small subunit
MNWDDIRNEYELTDITLKALAEKYNIKIGTLKSRKSRDGWSRDPTKRDATKSVKVATPSKRMQPQSEPELIIENDNLTEKQKLFCLYYIKYFNATKAYMKAYGVDRSTAESIAYRLMGKDGVKGEIERLKQERFNGVFLDAKAVLQKYIDIAFADITDFVEFGQKEQPEIDLNGAPVLDENGDPVMYQYSFVNLKNDSDVDGSIITEVKKGKDGVSIKLEDRMKALDKLSLYFDLFPDKFKRQIEEEKVKLARKKVSGDEEEEFEDDGFIEALNGKVPEVWDDEE